MSLLLLLPLDQQFIFLDISFSTAFFFPVLLLIVHPLHHRRYHDRMREVHFLQSVKLLWALVFLLVLGYNEVFGRMATLWFMQWCCWKSGY